jgi:tRNA threonylcarbamoyladenosine biosynthesis protein TsaE
VATFISSSAAETEASGRQFAPGLHAGDIVALQGELGAGKTHMIKGIVAGLGSADPVTSPTFTLVHEYSGGRLPVYHFDFFRLEDARSAARLGLDDYFFSEGVSLVEWADRFPELLPKEARWIRIEVKSPQERVIHLP